MPLKRRMLTTPRMKRVSNEKVFSKTGTKIVLRITKKQLIILGHILMKVNLENMSFTEQTKEQGLAAGHIINELLCVNS